MTSCFLGSPTIRLIYQYPTHFWISILPESTVAEKHFGNLQQLGNLLATFRICTAGSAKVGSLFLWNFKLEVKSWLSF